MTRWLSRITLFLLIALSLLLSIAACAEDETVYWINPDGGRYYHLDQNCPSIHPRYLPLTVYLTKEELGDQPVLLPQQGQQQVQLLDLLVIVLQGNALGVLNGLHGFFGVLIGIHDNAPFLERTLALFHCEC